MGRSPSQAKDIEDMLRGWKVSEEGIQTVLATGDSLRTIQQYDKPHLKSMKALDIYGDRHKLLFGDFNDFESKQKFNTLAAKQEHVHYTEEDKKLDEAMKKYPFVDPVKAKKILKAAAVRADILNNGNWTAQDFDEVFSWF